MAKIIGGVASTTMPVPDWEQTNPKRADYIKNKPFEKVDDALSATSTNPVQNKVVAVEIDGIKKDLYDKNNGLSITFGFAMDALDNAETAQQTANSAGAIAYDAKSTLDYDVKPRLGTLETKVGDIDTAIADMQPVVFTVTKNGDEYVSSKTYQELIDILAENEHQSIICNIGGYRLPLVAVVGRILVFSTTTTIWTSTTVHISSMDGLVTNVSVYSEEHSIEINGQLWDSDDPNADFTDTINKMIDDKVGDVETALDGIIALQQTLIGGGSV